MPSTWVISFEQGLSGSGWWYTIKQDNVAVMREYVLSNNIKRANRAANRRLKQLKAVLGE
jgi:hypothetical protein